MKTLNDLYFGDCLAIIKKYLPDQSVDLIYLDPPFNSKRDYNQIFKSPSDDHAHASITTFKDCWHWGKQAEEGFRDIIKHAPSSVADLMVALRSFLKENDMMAYLVMMVSRLLEMHRVLKSNGSIYLHCDPTASHYIKIVLDAVFGKENYRNHITWQRTSAHNDKQGKQYGRNVDHLFFYSCSNKWTWNKQFTPYTQEYIDDYFNKEDQRGRYQASNLTGAGTPVSGASGQAWRGIHPANIGNGRHWSTPREAPPGIDALAYGKMNTLEKLDALDTAQRIEWPKSKSAKPRLKLYLSEQQGIPLQSLWTDIPSLGVFGSNPKERLGYPTQKPLALLERIIQVSSNRNDVILDPFCGCGTAVHAAQNLKRQWIGIDITHLSVSLMRKRLTDAFGKSLSPSVHGIPKDLASARYLADQDQLNQKYEFQYWACSLVNARPLEKKGADHGVDGLDWFLDELDKYKKVVVSVKGGKNLGVSMIRDLKSVIATEKAEIGLFVTLYEPTKEMIKEALIAGFYSSPGFKQEWPRIQILTIEELLAGKTPKYHSFDPDASFKRAEKESSVRPEDQQELNPSRK